MLCLDVVVEDLVRDVDHLDEYARLVALGLDQLLLNLNEFETFRLLARIVLFLIIG